MIKTLLIDRWGRRRDDFDWRVYQSPIDLASVKSVLVLHLNDKLGDALFISMLVDALAKVRSDLPISVGTTAGFYEYWRRDPLVREVATFPPSGRAERGTLRRIRDAWRAARPWRGRFDALISFEPYAKADHFRLVRDLGARVSVGFNKHPYALFTYSLEERRHGVVAESVATRNARVMEAFGCQVDLRSLRPNVPFDDADVRAVRPLIETAGPGPLLLLNTYGAVAEKRLSPEATTMCVREIRRAGHAGPVLLSLPPGGDAATLRALGEGRLETGVVPFEPMADAFKLFALVSMVDAVVSPDTAVGHVAAAFSKPQACLFARGGTVPMAWRPFSDRCVSLVSTSGKNVSDLDAEAFADAMRQVLRPWGALPPEGGSSALEGGARGGQG